MKKADPLVFFRPDLFPVGDTIDELYKETATPLRSDLEQYLVDHDANLQDKVDQVIRDLLASKNVRAQLDKKRPGRKAYPTARTLALAREHARLMKNGIKKATATKLLVKALKIHGERGDDRTLSKEIQRARREFPSTATDINKYESKLNSRTKAPPKICPPRVKT